MLGTSCNFNRSNSEYLVRNQVQAAYQQDLVAKGVKCVLIKVCRMYLKGAQCVLYVQGVQGEFNVKI